MIGYIKAIREITRHHRIHIGLMKWMMIISRKSLITITKFRYDGSRTGRVVAIRGPIGQMVRIGMHDAVWYADTDIGLLVATNPGCSV